MTDHPPSGNRWEHTPEPTTKLPATAGAFPTPTPAADVQSAAAPPSGEVVTPPGSHGRRLPGWVKGVSLWVAAVGAAAFLIGGAVGFGVGRAVSDDHRTTVPVRGPGAGFDRDRGFDRHDFGGPGSPGDQDGQGRGQDQDEGTGT